MSATASESSRHSAAGGLFNACDEMIYALNRAEARADSMTYGQATEERFPNATFAPPPGFSRTTMKMFIRLLPDKTAAGFEAVTAL